MGRGGQEEYVASPEPLDYRHYNMDQQQAASFCESHICAHTHGRAQAFPNSFLPKRLSLSARQNVLQNSAVSNTDLLRISLIWEKVIEGFVSFEYPFHFLFFKCHEDWVAWIWQYMWINDICHLPSFSARRPLCPPECVIFMSGQPPVSAPHSCP